MMQEQLASGIRVTPKEVDKFFAGVHAEDELPFI